jgi:hypothetical protein
MDLKDDVTEEGKRLEFKTEPAGSRAFAPSQGHKLSHTQLSKSLPEHLMAGMNAEHDAVLSVRLSEIRNHKYPKSRGLPPPAKFMKAHSAPGRLARACSADEIRSNMEYDGSCHHRPRVISYDFEQVMTFFPTSLYLHDCI